MISQDREVRVDYERRRMAYHDAVSLRRDSRLEGLEEGKRLGAQAALVNAVVAVLAARGLALGAAHRARLDAETDLTRLEQWTARAAVVSSVEDLLNG